MTVHVIGAGMAGLSAAFYLTEKSVPVVIYEAGNRAGGRCHTYFDKRLGETIDAGVHLMTGANSALLEMLSHCPTETPLQAIEHDFLFFNVSEKRFFNADPRRPLSFIGHGRELWALFAESVMNTPANEADLLMLLKTGLLCLGKKGGTAYLASPSLKASVIDPLESELKRRGVIFKYGRRLTDLSGGKMIFDGETVQAGENDKIISALPFENLSSPIGGKPSLPANTIIGIHYKTDAQLPENRRFIGLTGATGHWIFKNGNVLSATISAADALLARRSPEEIAATVWEEIGAVLQKSAPLPLYRFIASKRATLFQSRRVNALRPTADKYLKEGVILAGAATRTGLPCTIEGAVRSGKTAAQKAL